MSDDLRLFLRALADRWVVERVIEVEGSAGRFQRVLLRSVILTQYTISLEVDVMTGTVPQVGEIGHYAFKRQKGAKGLVLGGGCPAVSNVPQVI